jgi:inner membrane protein
MDNVTHSLIGAVMGQAGLKRRTGLAMPALIIGANIPDIDGACSIYGIESLAMRRGITHGPLAMIVLPLVLAGLLIAWDRWQARRGTRPPERLPVKPGWLLALCFIGTASHPLFDWMNNYGIRLLEPFSSRWFYGDVLFIIDPWLLAALVAGIWLSRRKERTGDGRWQVPAQAAIAAVVLYVSFNIGLSRMLVMHARNEAPYPQVAVANPVPLAFWRREVLWRDVDGRYGAFPCILLDCRRYPLEMWRTNLDDPRLSRRASSDPALRAFLFWSRMPVVRRDGDGAVLMDQRYMDRAGPSFSIDLGNTP